MNIAYIIITIIVAGVFGGLINKFRDKGTEAKYFISIIKGVGAALLVPLFLKIVQSDIIRFEEPGWYDYFVFGGLCLVLAIFSDRFFESIAQGLIKQVEIMKDKVNKIDERSKEVDGIEKMILKDLKPAIRAEPNEDTGKVIRAITGSPYTYRTVEGIHEHTGLPQDRISDILTALEDQGFAEREKNKKGVDVWRVVVK